MASKAKVIVYGVLYGQAEGALAKQLGVGAGTASKIRSLVLKTYPRLSEYIRTVKEDCKKCG